MLWADGSAQAAGRRRGAFVACALLFGLVGAIYGGDAKADPVREGGAALLAASQGGPSAGASRQVTVGRSVRGRKIQARRAGDPTAAFKALIVGSIHGDEPEGLRIVRQLRRRVSTGVRDVDLWTITTVNPDGLAAGTRKNRRGVDLNRNFGFRWSRAEPPGSGYYGGTGPFSEPESKAVRKLIKRVKPKVTAWYHQPWGRTLVPCDWRARYARRYAALSGLSPSSRCDSHVPGSAIEWLSHTFGTAALVVELPGRPLRANEVTRHVRAVVGLLRSMPRTWPSISPSRPLGA